MNTNVSLSGLKELWPLRAVGDSIATSMKGARALFQPMEIAGAERRSIVEFLAQVSLFQDLSRRDLARLARIVHERNYGDGEYVCEQGRPGAALFIVRRGVVEVVRPSAGGEEVSLALLEAPASFEEPAAIGMGTIRWFSVRARGPVSLLALGKSDVDALIADFPALANKVLVRLAGIMAIRLQMLIDAELLGESNADEKKS